MIPISAKITKWKKKRKSKKEKKNTAGSVSVALSL
jgi:hypothetical protein